MQSVIDTEMEVIRQRVGREAHVICALSGGVDSTVAATLVHKVIGDRLHCVFVDNGLLRYKEAERVMVTFQVRFGGGRSVHRTRLCKLCDLRSAQLLT
jgi:GMP synthase (glutamine-hydrolysing)